MEKPEGKDPRMDTGAGARDGNLEGGPERSSAERSEAERSVGASSKFRAASGRVVGELEPVNPPDPEVSDKAKRRRFTAQYKQSILKKADACTRPGELGALLRREGIYSSSLSAWRRQRDAGVLSGLGQKKRGRKPEPVNPLASRVVELEREVEGLQGKLVQAETIIEIQKKLSEMLGGPASPLVSIRSEE